MKESWWFLFMQAKSPWDNSPPVAISSNCWGRKYPPEAKPSAPKAPSINIDPYCTPNKWMHMPCSITIRALKKNYNGIMRPPEIPIVSTLRRKPLALNLSLNVMIIAIPMKNVTSHKDTKIASTWSISSPKIENIAKTRMMTL